MSLLAQSVGLAEAADPGFFTTLISGFDPQQRFVLCIVAMGCLTGLTIALVGTLAGVWQSVRRREAEVELTRDLLDQGKSAEEIEKIIRPADGFARAAERWSKRC
ncbi:hypothetical protein MalM25_37930 [Planctomycetes bacterium MalM25]|nr:hypothetical protein MalM25_37930 [Planctomycetes bacterium MalM25]